MRSKGSLNLKTFWIGILFLLPISVMMVTFMLIPVFQTMYYSFTNWDGLG